MCRQCKTWKIVFTLTQNPSLRLSTKILVYKAVVIYTFLIHESQRSYQMENKTEGFQENAGKTN